MPAVSVLMVFHRDTPFLRPAIASVLSQTFRDFEFVLVDNGTGLRAADLGELGNDPRLRWVRLARNEGIPAGHNAGVAAAHGKFIALLDYDDLLLPTRFERQVAALEADPALGLVSALAERMDESGRAIGHEFCLGDSTEHQSYAPYAAPVITPVAMGRREVFTTFPYRAEFPFAADLDFQSRVVERWRMAVLPEVLMRYRWYREQTTQQRNPAIEQSRCVIQVITGRRQAGRAEAINAVLEATAATTAAATWRRGAALCLRERFPVFAAFQARRSLALDRSVPGAWRAVALAARAWRQAPAEDRALVRRMFLTGPVRALGLHPAGRDNGAPSSALESMAPAA
jgi:hypothetical protein